MKRSIVWLAGLIIVFAQNCRADPYTFQILGSLQPNAINNQDQIVGQYFNLATGGEAGFSLKGGVFDTIFVTGSQSTIANGVNGNGDIVGSYGGAVGPGHGLLLRQGLLTTIDYPNAADTNLGGINDAGQIAGDYIPPGQSSFTGGFLYSGGMFQNLPLPAVGLNNQGQVIAELSGVGYLMDHGAVTPIFFPGSIDTEVMGINDNGQIVGFYTDAAFFSHGFLLSNGVYSTFDFSGSGFTRVGGINDRGQIVGFEITNGSLNGFLATPVPEPSSISLLALALGLAAFGRWRRARATRLWRRVSPITNPAGTVPGSPSIQPLH